MVDGDEIVKVGDEFTLTILVLVTLQPFAFVPITVYVVVIEGFAVTEDPVALFKLEEGDHR